MLAVLITATVLSAATALASIVVAQLRQSRDTVSSIAALSLAQSRIERALFTLRKTIRLRSLPILAKLKIIFPTGYPS